MKIPTLSSDILTLEKGTGEICISVIVPTHRIEQMAREDSTRLKTAVEKAKDQLLQQNPKRKVQQLIESLDELQAQADLHEKKDGLGLYVSEKVKLLKRFEFPVTEKVVIAVNFEIRDLLVEEQYSKPYYFLLLTKTIARLFHGKMNILEEITGKDFPKEFIDDYEYQHPSPATSFSGRSLEKAVEKDKSILQEIREQRFIHDVDEHLAYYLGPETLLMVSAEAKALGYYRKITRHNENICGEVKGTYTHLNAKELGDLAWPEMKAYLDKMEDKMLEEFKETPAGRKATGLENAWKAVLEGRGHVLLVETDFHCQAFLDEFGLTLYRVPPTSKHTVLPDGVDDLVEKAAQMKTQVVFVQNGKLNDYGGVCLIFRDHLKANV